MMTFELGDVVVSTTQGRGASAEELTERALDKIVYVGGQSHPAVREQALAFREQIRGVILFYIKQAMQAQNTTITNKLHASGHAELTKLIE